jgi:integrase/recombinase XerD
MFESYFTMPDAIRRHRAAPLAKEREAFLDYLSENGTRRPNLRVVAAYLLTIVDVLKLRNLRDVTHAEIHAGARRWRLHGRRRNGRKPGDWSAWYFGWIARRWLRYEGKLASPSAPQPFAGYLQDYIATMSEERGLATATVRGRRVRASHFLRWYAKRHRQFCELSLLHVEAYISRECAHWTLVTRATEGADLRDFIRHAEAKGWCKPGVACSIVSPILRRDPFSRRGPEWRDVVRLLNSTKASTRADLRARALIFLFATYGVRNGEAARLRLEDIDWENETIMIRRSKRGGVQQFPLRREAAGALREYIERGRPSCSSLEVFVTLGGPYRPIIPNTVSVVVQRRMNALGIQSPRGGPHSIRHSFATQLLNIGRPYKEIADILGHQTSTSVSIYAKPSVQRLREVSDLDLVGAL